MPDNVNGRIMADTWAAANRHGYKLAMHAENYLLFSYEGWYMNVLFGVAQDNKTPVKFGW